jgi:hypothetical protein
MAESSSLHPAASHHLPSFITAPGETDVLMVAMAVILVLSVIGFGVLFLTLHTLPERIAHKSHKLQFEIVAVLGLIALFTHMHIFWIIGLLLALIDVPDLGGWLARITRSIEKIAETKSRDETTEAPAAGPAPTKRAAAASDIEKPKDGHADVGLSEGAWPARPQRATATTRG